MKQSLLKYIIPAGIVIVIVGLFIYSFYQSSRAPRTPDSSAQYKESFSKIAPTEAAFYKKKAAISEFYQTKLPYYGKNFSLHYDLSSATFILVLNKKNEAAGKKEFEDFLKPYNLERSLMVIKTQYEEPS